MIRLHTFSSDQLAQLKSRSHILGNREAYATGMIPENWGKPALPTSLEVELPALNTAKASDGDNAAQLHGALRVLSRLTATDERLWAWLALTQYPDYVAKRWPSLRAGDDALYSHIRNRWYFGERTPRARSGLARLWWGAELTGRPEEFNPRFFASMPETPAYLYTRVLFSRTDYQFQLIENQLALAPEILVPVLHFLKERQDTGNPVPGKMFLNGVIKELNLTTAYRRLELLTFELTLPLFSVPV